MLVLGLLATLMPAASSAAASESPVSGGSATAQAERGGQDPAADFPLLPSRCYDSANSRPVTPCRLEIYPRRPTVFLWGDSHAWMYLPAVRKLAQRNQLNLTIMFAGGCPPARGERADRTRYCEAHNERALAMVTEYQQLGRDYTVILASWWAGYRQAYRRLGRPGSSFTAYETHQIMLAHNGTSPLFTALRNRKIRVNVVAPSAYVPLNAPACPAGESPYACPLPRSAALNAEVRNRQWLKSLIRPLAGSPRYIDPTSVYCTTTTCLPSVGRHATFFDAIHLGAGLTSTMTSYFAPVFRDLIRRSR